MVILNVFNVASFCPIVAAKHVSGISISNMVLTLIEHNIKWIGGVGANS